MLRRAVAVLSALGFLQSSVSTAYVVYVAIYSPPEHRSYVGLFIWSLPVVFFALAFATSSNMVRQTSLRTAVTCALLSILPFLGFAAWNGLSWVPYLVFVIAWLFAVGARAHTDKGGVEAVK